MSPIYQDIYGPRCAKTCLLGFANIKATDQPALPRSLISAFVIHCFESIISKLATIFLLVSVALLEILQTGFVASKPIIIIIKRVD